MIESKAESFSWKIAFENFSFLMAMLKIAQHFKVSLN